MFGCEGDWQQADQDLLDVTDELMRLRVMDSFGALLSIFWIAKLSVLVFLQHKAARDPDTAQQHERRRLQSSAEQEQQ